MTTTAEARLTGPASARFARSGGATDNATRPDQRLDAHHRQAVQTRHPSVGPTAKPDALH